MCFKNLAYDEPYFIGILPGKGVEVRTIRPKLKIDSFPISQPKLAFRTKSGRVFISSSNSIWCLKSTPIDTQMDLFVKQKHFELALSLSVSLNDVELESIMPQYNNISHSWNLDFFRKSGKKYPQQRTKKSIRSRTYSLFIYFVIRNFLRPCIISQSLELVCLPTFTNFKPAN